MVDYKLKKIIPGIYAVKIKDPYQRAMLFLRSQEFYESQFDQIRGTHFDFFEFMDIYRKWRKKDYFSYPEEWVGFNVPGHIVENCTNFVLDARNGISSTPYDRVMRDIISSIRKEVKNSKFYLIGVNKFESKLMDHELSHGLFYIDSQYQKDCLKLTKKIPRKIYKSLKKAIVKMGYGEEVVDDEIQAYLSTGLYPSMKKIEGIGKYSKLFKANFQNYKSKYEL